MTVWPTAAGFSRLLALEYRSTAPFRQAPVAEKAAIERRGRTTVITGWRAWLIGLAAFAAASLLMALIFSSSSALPSRLARYFWSWCPCWW
jgi:hypothetical protein